jgi:hypothetical protein
MYNLSLEQFKEIPTAHLCGPTTLDTYFHPVVDPELEQDLSQKLSTKKLIKTSCSSTKTLLQSQKLNR